MASANSDASLPDLPGPASRDDFLGGKIRLVQPERGHRAGLDAALLQAAVPDTAKGQLVELGCGAGQAVFAVCARAPDIKAIGVDSDEDILRYARCGLMEDHNRSFSDRVALIECDATEPLPARERAGLTDNMADWVMMNPPFWTEGTMRNPKQPGRRKAHVATHATLTDWVSSAAGLLKPGGTLVLIHQAERLHDVLNALHGKFGDLTIRPIQPRIEQPASRILIAAQAASRAPMRLLPPHILHNDDGSWTPETDAILRGDATL